MDALNLIDALGSIFIIVGLPVLFTMITRLHKKHVETLEARIAGLQDEIQHLKERSPEKLAGLLRAEQELIETAHDALKKEKERAKRLAEELGTVRRSLEIMERYWSGADYRYELLREQ